jgi:glycosyltransferase involved in cell wall biosynthesis
VKTLLVANFPPYPPSSGTPLRVWQHINVLATRGPVHVFSVGGEREPGTTAMPGVASWTHFNSSEFSTSDGPFAKIARALFPRQYVLPDTFARFPINRALRAEIDRFAPDLIVLSHWKHACPAPLRRRNNLVVDLHNIESLHAPAVRTRVKSKLLLNALLWRWRMRERALVRRAKRVWVCGPNDAVLLKELDPRAPSPEIVPNAVDVGRYARLRSGAACLPGHLEPAFPTIVYVGMYAYQPNAEAALELIEGVFPLVLERLPAARLLLVGGGATSEMKQAAAPNPRVVLAGWVDDVEPYLAAADVCVVPLRTGGGTRLKILECFAAGIPVVSTAKGAEGIDAVPGRDIRIAETSRELADSALELMSDGLARRRQADCAYDLVEKVYSWDAIERRIDFAVS